MKVRNLKIQIQKTKIQTILPNHVAVLFLTTAAYFFSFWSFLFLSFLSLLLLFGASSLKNKLENFDYLSRTLQKCQKTKASWSPSLLMIDQQPFFLIDKLI